MAPGGNAHRWLTWVINRASASRSRSYRVPLREAPYAQLPRKRSAQTPDFWAIDGIHVVHEQHHLAEPADRWVCMPLRETLHASPTARILLRGVLSRASLWGLPLHCLGPRIRCSP